MPKKVRISAETIAELRDFLVGADVDMGCRPVAEKAGDTYATTVVSEQDELNRMSARRLGTVRIEVLEEMPDPRVRLRMLHTGNRFDGGRVPKGLGIKE